MISKERANISYPTIPSLPELRMAKRELRGAAEEGRARAKARRLEAKNAENFVGSDADDASDAHAIAAVAHSTLTAFACTLKLSPCSLECLVQSANSRYARSSDPLDQAAVALLYLLFTDGCHLSNVREPNARNPAGSAPRRSCAEPPFRILPHLDSITWPKFASEYLRARAENDPSGSVPPRKLVGGRAEEFHQLPPVRKLRLLAFLSDDFCETPRARSAARRLELHQQIMSRERNSRGDPSLCIGAVVEVAMVKKGFRGSYFRATVMQADEQRMRARVRFDALSMNEDASKPLEEWIELQEPVKLGNITPAHGGSRNRRNTRSSRRRNEGEDLDDDVSDDNVREEKLHETGGKMRSHATNESQEPDRYCSQNHYEGRYRAECNGAHQADELGNELFEDGRNASDSCYGDRGAAGITSEDASEHRALKEKDSTGDPSGKGFENSNNSNNALAAHRFACVSDSARDRNKRLPQQEDEHEGKEEDHDLSSATGSRQRTHFKERYTRTSCSEMRDSSLRRSGRSTRADKRRQRDAANAPAAELSSPGEGISQHRVQSNVSDERSSDSNQQLASKKLKATAKNVARLRPLPPLETERSRQEAKRCPGDHVEVFGLDGYWLGVIRNEAEDGSLQVFLPGEKRDVCASRKDVRTALHFDGHSWSVWDTDETLVLGHSNETNPRVEHNDEFCSLCFGTSGEMLMCKHCPCAFHRLSCIDEPLEPSTAHRSWICPSCRLLPAALRGKRLLPSMEQHFLGYGVKSCAYWSYRGTIMVQDEEKPDHVQCIHKGHQLEALAESVHSEDAHIAKAISHAREKYHSPGEKDAASIYACETDYVNVYAPAQANTFDLSMKRAKGYADEISYSGRLKTHEYCRISTELGLVAMRLLNAEHRLLPVMERWWCTESNRRYFQERVHLALSANELAHCVLALESGIKRNALSASWHNDNESAKVLAIDNETSRNEYIGPKAFGQDPVDCSDITGGLPINFASYRSLKMGLCSGSPHKHKAMAKLKQPDGIAVKTDKDKRDSTWVRRKQWLTWRSETERAHTCATVALQLRGLEGHIKWPQMLGQERAVQDDDLVLVERRNGSDQVEYRASGERRYRNEDTLPLHAVVAFEQWAVRHIQHLACADVELNVPNQADDLCAGSLVHISSVLYGDVRGKILRFRRVTSNEDTLKETMRVAVVRMHDENICQIPERDLMQLVQLGQISLIKPQVHQSNGKALNDNSCDFLIPADVEPEWLSNLSGLEELCAIVKENTGKDLSRKLRSITKKDLIALLPHGVLDALDQDPNADVPRGDTSKLAFYCKEANDDEHAYHDDEEIEENAIADELSTRNPKVEHNIGNAHSESRRTRQKRNPAQASNGLSRQDVGKGLELLENLRRMERSDGEQLSKPVEQISSKQVTYPCDFTSIEATLQRSAGGFTSVTEMLCAFELCFMSMEESYAESVQEQKDATTLRDAFQEKASQLFPGHKIPTSHAPLCNKKEWEVHAQLATEITTQGEEEEDIPRGDDEFQIEDGEEDDEMFEGEDDDDDDDEDDWAFEEALVTRESKSKMARRGNNLDANFASRKEQPASVTKDEQHQSHLTTNQYPSASDQSSTTVMQPSEHQAMIQQAFANLNAFVNKSILVQRVHSQWWSATIRAIDMQMLSITVTYHPNSSTDSFNLMAVDTSICHGVLNVDIHKGMHLALLREPKNAVWCAGVVKEIDRNGIATLQYDNGGCENVNLKKVYWQIINKHWWLHAFPAPMQQYLCQYWEQQRKMSSSHTQHQQSATTGSGHEVFPVQASPVTPTKMFTGRVNLAPQQCLHLLNVLRQVNAPEDKTHRCAQFFESVDQRHFPSPAEHVDLTHVEQKLRSGAYQSAQHFKNDLDKLFAYVSRAYPQHSWVYRDAKYLIDTLHYLLCSWAGPGGGAH